VEVRHRAGAADDGEVALVAVAERPAAPVAQPGADERGRVATLLHGDGRDTGEHLRLSAGVADADHVAEREHLRAPRQREVGLDGDAARPVDVTGGLAWLVYEYDGDPLEPEHGGPARLLVPHLYFWEREGGSAASASPATTNRASGSPTATTTTGIRGRSSATRATDGARPRAPPGRTMAARSTSSTLNASRARPCWRRNRSKLAAPTTAPGASVRPSEGAPSVWITTPAHAPTTTLLTTATMPAVVSASCHRLGRRRLSRPPTESTYGSSSGARAR
jgi:hypothetical protein